MMSKKLNALLQLVKGIENKHDAIYQVLFFTRAKPSDTLHLHYTYSSAEGT